MNEEILYYAWWLPTSSILSARHNFAGLIAVERAKEANYLPRWSQDCERRILVEI